MARFDNEFIERLKSETDIVRLIESYGTKLKARAGDEFIGLCPIHNDTSPSLVVNRKKNVWNCLGACKKGGDVIQWIMEVEKVGFRHAVELLANGAVGQHGRQGKAKTCRRLPVPFEPTAADHELLGQIADYYHQCLKQTPKALEYLAKRGLTNGEMIDRFKIGFCDRSLSRRLPISKQKAGAEIRTRLKKLGVLSEHGHEVFRGFVTFPIQLHGGGVGEIYGRRIDNHPKDGAPLHSYLKGPHGGVWNLPAIIASEEIILCESIIDALTFWNSGYRNVTAAYGINGFTDKILEAFIAHDIKRVLIAYDNDDAGNGAADELAGQLMRGNFDVFRIKVTAAAKDINNYAKIAGKGHNQEKQVNDWLGLLIRNATWLGNGNAPDLQTQLPELFQQLPRLKKPIAETEPAAAKVEDAPRREKKPVAAEASEANPTPEKQSNLAPEAAGPTPASLATTNGPAASLLESKASSLAAEIAAVPAAAQPPKEPPLASPLPAAPQGIEAKVGEREITLEIGNRSYRVRGLEKNLAFDVLKVNVLVRSGEQFYVDTFDLYAARARSVFVKESSRELGFDPDVMKRDLGKVLLQLESLQDKNIEDTLSAKDEQIELTDKDKAAALELLKQPNLIERILSDFTACGVVGEETNKLVGYLAATSRKLTKPLAVVIQSSSAAGKSSLMDAILRFIPNEEQVGYSAMTGQSLFYMGGMELKNKILSIAEEEGVAQASYALKLLQSEGQLTIASTGKDPGTGRMETQEYHVEGPVMIFLTTTAIDIDEELLNRCVVLTVDENRDQTRAIHDQQRKNETLAGLLSSTQSASVRKLHQNAQRLIRPLRVVNPFASELSFVDDRARRRRDHMKYLTLIQSIALLHQYQRPIKSATVGDESVQYIEVQRSDIALANRLADQILGRSIDELPPQTRRLLIELYDLVAKHCKENQLKQSEYRFTRRFIRESLGWGQTALKKHIDRLQEMEYILPHRGSGRRTEYELLYDGRGREGQPTMCGLVALPPDNKPQPLEPQQPVKEEQPTAVPTTKTTGDSSQLQFVSSPLIVASSPLKPSSSPQDHPVISPSSQQVINGKPSNNGVKPK